MFLYRKRSCGGGVVGGENLLLWPLFPSTLLSRNIPPSWNFFLMNFFSSDF